MSIPTIPTNLTILELSTTSVTISFSSDTPADF